MESGIKTVILNEEEMAKFYEGTYPIETMLNEYVFIKNREGEVVDKLKSTKDGELVQLKYKAIESKVSRFNKIKPLNDEQVALFDLLQDKSITVKQITGVAGSGKNYCAFTYALDCVDRGLYKKLVLIRNNVGVKDSCDLGALPAGINEKLLPWAMPAADLLGSTSELYRLIEDEKIELLHLGFARGRSFEESIIIVDESENLTGDHMALLVSRVGKNSIILFLGDTAQVDKPVFAKDSGLEKLNSRLFGKTELYGCVHLVKTERSKTAALAQFLQ